MNTTQTAKNLIQESLAELERAIAQGQSEALKTYLAFSARFHRYSLSNVLLIRSQCPEASHVAGFRAWKKMGRHVLKGQKGLKIVVPIPVRAKQPNEEDAVRFKIGHVFDISQTDGDPLPEPERYSGIPGPWLERLHEFARTSELRVTKVASLGGADGTSAGGAIQILDLLPPAQEFQVLTHEIAHELLHQVPGEERPSHAVRETEAEAVAYAVSRAVGLEGQLAASDYIQHHDGDVETLRTSLNRILRATNQILEGLEGTTSAPRDTLLRRSQAAQC